MLVSCGSRKTSLHSKKHHDKNTYNISKRSVYLRGQQKSLDFRFLCRLSYYAYMDYRKTFLYICKHQRFRGAYYAYMDYRRTALYICKHQRFRGAYYAYMDYRRTALYICKHQRFRGAYYAYKDYRKTILYICKHQRFRGTSVCTRRTFYTYVNTKDSGELTMLTWTLEKQFYTYVNTKDSGELTTLTWTTEKQFYTYVNTKDSGEHLFAHISSRPRRNFSQRTEHGLARDRSCALKYLFDGMSEVPSSQEAVQFALPKCIQHLRQECIR